MCRSRWDSLLRLVSSHGRWLRNTTKVPVLRGQERSRLSQELGIRSTLQIDPDRARYFACCLRIVGGEIRDQVVHGTTLPGAVAHHEDGIRPGQSLGDRLIIRGLFWRSLSGAAPFRAVDEMSLIAVRVIRLDPRGGGIAGLYHVDASGVVVDNHQQVQR